jgi:hypothetical protein
MRNKMLKSFLSWLLIASPLWWTTGCESIRAVEKLSDAQGEEIHVLTKDKRSYTFVQWKADSAGSIRGIAKWKDPSYFTWEPSPLITGERVVPSDSIASVCVKHANVPVFVVSIVGVLAFAAVCAAAWNLRGL